MLRKLISVLLFRSTTRCKNGFQRITLFKSTSKTQSGYQIKSVSRSANVLESILGRKLISSSGSTHRVAISLTSHRYLESSPLNTTTSIILRKNRFRIGIEYLNLTGLTSRQRYMNGSSDYRRKMQLLQAKSSNNRL